MDPNQQLPEEQHSLLDKFPFLRKRSVQIIALFVVAFLMFIPIGLFVISSNQAEKDSGKKEETIDPFSAPYVKDQLIVKYKDEYTLDQILNLKKELEGLGVTDQESLFNSDDPGLRNFYVLTFKNGTDVKKIKEKLDTLPEIDFAGPNSISKVQVDPNDPYFSQQWDMAKISMPASWDITKGSNNVVVGIIDTGIDYRNPDLATRTITGYDFINGDADPMDDMGHGTHVAGTIGAVTNNGIGVAGINWDVSLMAVKTMGADGSGATSTIVQGIQYAVDHGAKVINMSITTPLPCSQLTAYKNAIEYGASKGVVFVAAAGNDNKDASGYTPSSCPDVISVGATDQNDARATFSNYGSSVDIAAPGVNIISTKASSCTKMCPASKIVGENYSSAQGTSMASPHVAGAAALILALKGSLSASQVATCLIGSADPISTDKPIGKRLNVLNALNACSGVAPVTPTVGVSPTASPLTPTVQPTTAPIPNTNSSNSSLNVNIIIDQNGNRAADPGEPGYQGAQLSLSGPVAGSGVTNPLGKYTFNNLKPGQYILSVAIPGANVPPKTFDILSNQVVTYSLIIQPQVLTVIPSATPVPVDTPVIIVSPTRVPSPTPTPPTTYSCHMNPGGKQPNGAISIGNLVCTPNPR